MSDKDVEIIDFDLDKDGVPGRRYEDESSQKYSATEQALRITPEQGRAIWRLAMEAKLGRNGTHFLSFPVAQKLQKTTSTKASIGLKRQVESDSGASRSAFKKQKTIADVPEKQKKVADYFTKPNSISSQHFENDTGDDEPAAKRKKMAGPYRFA